jgi:hypothetical protein
MIEGLSISIELRNGSPILFDPVIDSYWEILVLSNGARFKRGIVARRYIFAMQISWHNEGIYVSPDNKNIIVDTRTEVAAVELYVIDSNPALDVTLERGQEQRKLGLCFDPTRIN